MLSEWCEALPPLARPGPSSDYCRRPLSLSPLLVLFGVTWRRLASSILLATNQSSSLQMGALVL